MLNNMFILNQDIAIEYIEETETERCRRYSSSSDQVI